MKKFVNSEEFKQKNKDYYRLEEDYDWIKVTDKIVGLESFFHKTRQRNFLRQLKSFLQKDQKVLDAGCGTGLFSRFLPDGSYGIDINPRNLAKARQHAPAINFMEADLEQLPFENDSFDLIIITEVIEHFPDPLKLLSELKRVLKTGGVILGTVPAKSFIWQLRFLSSTRPREPYHRYYSKKELNDLLKQFFEVDDLKQGNFFMTMSFVLKK